MGSFGGFANRNFWRKQIKPFSKKYHVIVLDLGGHGESGDTREKISLVSFAEDVYAVMEMEKVNRVILVGNSLGGEVALETARLAPDKVVGIIAADTLQTFKTEVSSEYIEKIAAGFRANFKETMRNMIDLLFHKDVDPKIRAYVMKNMMNNSSEMVAQVMEAFIGYSMMDTLKKLSIPIRCINGDLFPTKVQENKVIYNDYDAVIIPGTGHYPMLECPEIFNRRLWEILEKIDVLYY